MKIKKIAKKVVRGIGDTIKVAGLTAPFWFPAISEAKALDLQKTQADIAKKYLNGMEFKVDKDGYNIYWGLISDISKGKYFNIGVRAKNENTSWNAAILGKRLGIEAESDFNKNTSLTLDYIVGGQVGLGVTGKYDGHNVDLAGSIFRAEQIGGTTLYGKLDASEDNVDVSGMVFYIPSKSIGSIKIIPAALASKSLTSKDYHFLTGAIVSAGKVGAGILIGTSDFDGKWNLGIKIKYKH